MKLILWQPRTYSLLIPLIVVILSMIVETIPITLSFFSYIKPSLFFIFIWYFHFHYPRYLPLWLIFLLGIFYDIETGQRIGVTALALWLSFIYPRFFRKNFHEQHGINFLLKFAVCMALYIFGQQSLMVLFGAEWQNAGLLLSRFATSLVLTPFLWRFLSFFDKYMSRI
ncbi:MAG: rod shape-determining protein MreD [Alphaproteobacteria bacterium]